MSGVFYVMIFFPSSTNDGDQAWLDDITWPGDSSVSVDFENATH